MPFLRHAEQPVVRSDIATANEFSICRVLRHGGRPPIAFFLALLGGAAIGAASGALGGKFTDVGINDQFMTDAAGALQPGTAGLFLLIRNMTTDKVLADLRGVAP
jgi:uncharacterized membrane protein